MSIDPRQYTSDVIKNPARSIPTIQQKYEPEYVRLGVDPVVGNSTVSSEELPGNVLIQDEDEWNSVIGSVVGDYDMQSGHIIDNNEFVDYATAKQAQATPSIKQQVLEPKEGEYILMVLGKTILTGNLSSIEDRVKSIIYGEDAVFRNTVVNVSDIVVLKRIGIKMGVFIDD